MKTKTLFFLLLSLVLLGGQTRIRAQDTAAEQDVCEPSVEDILFLINPIKNWNPSFEGILAAGEFKSTGILKTSVESLSVMQFAAMFGGVLKTAVQPVYLIRQSENETRIKLKINFNNIKTGRTADVKLKKGDIVFVSRGCIDGKLLPSTKPTLPSRQMIPKGVDLPLIFDKRRV